MKHGTINRQPPGVTRARVLTAISAYLTEHGYAPTLRELMLLVGIASTGTLRGHMQALRTAGKIHYEDYKTRTIRLTERE